MRRIALVVPSVMDGGGVPSVASFIKNVVLKSGDFDVRVISLAVSRRDSCSVRLVSPRTWRHGVKVRTGEWEGLRYHHVGAAAVEVEFQRYRTRAVLTQLLSDCDLVQVVAGGASWALPVTGLGKPVVLQVATRAIIERRRRALVEKGLRARWSRAMTHITDRLEISALRRVDAVLVDNAWMLEFAKEMTSVDDTWVRYAPPGVDTHVFRPALTSAIDNPEPGYILAVGRWGDPRKNVELLLESFAVMRRRIMNPPHLKLAGIEDPGLGFWARVESLGLGSVVSFECRPGQSALVGLYQNALCLAVPSDEEGFGMVLIEAMACGLPVVATQCGGPEGILTDGVEGYLVPRGDAAAMAGRLAEIVQDETLRRTMGGAARDAVERHFALGTAGAVYLETYERLLTDQARPAASARNE